MSVKLRLRRVGKRNRPYYRICAIESSRARDAQYIESFGHYDPYIADDQKKVQFDKERAEYWLSVGATPSDTVRSFLRRAQVSGLAAPRKKKRKRKTPPSKVAAGKARATERRQAKKSGGAAPMKAGKSKSSKGKKKA